MRASEFIDVINKKKLPIIGEFKLRYTHITRKQALEARKEYRKKEK